MSTSKIPSKSRTWQYNSTTGGLEHNLKLNTVDLRPAKSNEHLVQILAVGLNPVDYQVAEIPYMGRMLVPKPATPGIDIAARMITPAASSSHKPQQLIFGVRSSTFFAGQGLREYALVSDEYIAELPSSVNILDAAAIGVAGSTSYQAIIPYVKKGDHIFINAGSGGTGTFGIQIAKLAGCHITTSCSTANMELCKSLGADIVLDYTKSDIIQQLVDLDIKFDHVIDNIGANPNLYWQCHTFTKPNAVMVSVGVTPSFEMFFFFFKSHLIPGFMGGGRRKRVAMTVKIDKEGLRQLAKWIAEGRLKVVIDSTFSFDEVPDAFCKLKTGQSKGKIVVKVDSA